MKRYVLSLAFFCPPEAHGRTPVRFADLSNYVPEIKSGNTPRLNEGGTAFLAPGPKAIEVGPVKERSIVYVAGGRWPNPAKIDHCWVNPEDGGEIVADLQNWVSAEYRKAGIGFNWLGKCKDYVGRYEIRTWFKRDHTWKDGNWDVAGGGGLSYIGPVDAALGGADGVGTMNISISRDVLGYGQSGFRQWFIDVTRATAVHEFGHALGLAHEQDRSDAPVCQDQRGSLPSGGAYLFVGQYDPRSIMNYCVDPTNVASLSEGDITGLKTLYPPASVSSTTTAPAVAPPPPGTVQPKDSWTIRVRSSNKCIDVKANAVDNGAILREEGCNLTTSQSFFADPVKDTFFQPRGTNSGRCIDIPGASSQSGTKLQLYTCNKTPAQLWRFSDVGGGWVQVVNQGNGKCFAIDRVTSQLQISPCSGQHFGFFNVGAVQPVGAKLMVTPMK